MKKDLEGNADDIARKWNPAMIDKQELKGKKVNWQFGEHGTRQSPSPERSTHHVDFPAHTTQGGFTAAERQEMSIKLRGSSMPKGYEAFP